MSENIPTAYQIMCNFLCRLLKTPLEFDSSALDDVVIIECSLQLLISSFHLEGSLRSVADIKHTLIGCCIVITFSYLNSIFLVPALFRRGPCLWSRPCCRCKIGASHWRSSKAQCLCFWAGSGRLIYYTLCEMRNVSCSKQTVFHIKSLTGDRTARLVETV